jgi:hypothetical protein
MGPMIKRCEGMTFLIVLPKIFMPYYIGYISKNISVGWGK